nr:hypothetical protein [Delftia acidovorans]
MPELQQALQRLGSPSHHGHCAMPALAKPASVSVGLARAACLTLLAVASWHAGAAAPADTADAAPKPAAATDFSRPASHYVASVAALRNYLQAKDEANNTQKAQSRQHFCFVQQHNRTVTPARSSVWMVWLEGGQIANLGQRRFTAKPSPDEAQWDGDALAEAKAIHLATDVRETAQETTGSSILVERAWVDLLLAQCKAKGRTIKVAPAR